MTKNDFQTVARRLATQYIDQANRRAWDDLYQRGVASMMGSTLKGLDALAWSLLVDSQDMHMVTDEFERVIRAEVPDAAYFLLFPGDEA